MPAAPLLPADDLARAAPPARVHVGKPEDLFPTPFVGQRVALRSPSRGREVRLFTVAKVFAADGDVVAELERVGHSGPSTERFDVLWRVREDTVDIRSHLYYGCCTVVYILVYDAPLPGYQHGVKGAAQLA